jgi:hypothetical protein
VNADLQSKTHLFERMVLDWLRLASFMLCAVSVLELLKSIILGNRGLGIGSNPSTKSRSASPKDEWRLQCALHLTCSPPGANKVGPPHAWISGHWYGDR